MRIIKEISRQMQDDATNWRRKSLPRVCAVLVLITFIAASTVGAIFLVEGVYGHGFLAFAAGIITGCVQIGTVMWIWYAYDKVCTRRKKERADVLKALTNSEDSNEIR
jgi:hypothetical protein